MESFIFGTSALGTPIPAFRTSRCGAPVLLLGGVHGNEIEGVRAALGLLAKLNADPSLALSLTLVPMLNIDGVTAGQRVNARGVDLNRNLPTKDWSPEAREARFFPGKFAGSEPENQALMGYLDAEKPQLILSLHSWHPVLNINGSCRPEAEAMAQILKYEISPDIGYPTPGCLGTFAGHERGIPTLTVEFQRGAPASDTPKFVSALWEALKVTEERMRS